MAVRSDLSQDGSVVTITVSGRFDFGAHHEFRTAYERFGKEAGVYEVDLGDATYLDSSALGMLLLLRDYAGGEAARVRLKRPNPDVRKILAISNFDKLFDIQGN